MAVQIIARVELAFGKRAEYYRIVGELRPVIERHGWKLAGAYGSALASSQEILNIWEASSVESAVAGIEGMASDPRFGELLAELDGVVVREDAQFFVPAPYADAA